MRLTRPNVARLTLPAGKSELIVFDETLPGFGVRLRAGGKRTWVAQYRIGAKQRRVSLGSVEAVDPDEARKLAKSTLAKAHLGADPQAEKAEAQAKAALTLGPMIETYLTTHAARRFKSKPLHDVTRYLRLSWKPLHGTPLHRIDRRAVAAQLATLAASNGPFAANCARTALSSFFTWAMRQGVADVNPVIGTSKPGEERARDRVLADKELTAIWRACLDNDYGRIVRLLILTGQRREEVGNTRLCEIDFEARRWLLPASRTKNGQPHEVPLSDAAAGLFRAAVHGNNRDLIFGRSGNGFSGWSAARAAFERRLAAAGHTLEPWRLHDIRRTVATRMAELGVLPHVVEAVLNHVSGHKAGVAGVYNRALYSAEKRQALDRWADHVTALVEGRASNVVALRVNDGR